MNDMIKTEALRFSYNPESSASKLILSDIDLNIKPGEYIAVLGHNGSGKSTLAKHFNGILLPSGGKVYIDGMDTANEAKLYDIRSLCGMVFQNPDNQIVATITEEDVAFGPENLGVEMPELRERVDTALKTVGMYEYRNHAPHLLSGGQKQRIAIAGIIAMLPRCIVLDEPTAMLDPVGRREVLSTIGKLNKEYKITIVLITHHMNEAVDADRILVMNNGKIEMDGTPKEIFQQVEKLRETGLDVPQTVDLLYELRGEGFDLPLDALSVEDCAQAIYGALIFGGAAGNGG